MDRARGGLTTKIHALTDACGLPLVFVLTPGQTGDCPQAAYLLDRVKPGTILLAEKANHADWPRRAIKATGAAPNIPSMRHGRSNACFSPVLYKQRSRLEHFFSKLKHFRCVATRYETSAANFLTFIQLAINRIWLRISESIT